MIKVLSPRRCIERIASGVAVRVEGSVAGEGRVVGIPKFHSWGKCTMPLTKINSDWIFNASSGPYVMLIIYTGPKVARSPVFSTNLESKLIGFFVFVRF